VRGRLGAIFRKEVVDNARDRRAWGLALLYVVLGPLMLVLTIQLTTRMSSRETTQKLDLPVAGGERAPGLLDFLRQRNVSVRPAPRDPEQAVRRGAEDLVLVVTPTYGDDLQAGRPAAVRILYDESRAASLGRVRRLTEALRGYSAAIGHLRLLARGVSPSAASALAIESDDLATPESRAQVVFGVMPMFLLLVVFVGGMYIAIDATAGERERGSLEPLLANPVTPTEVILGKLGATMAFTLVTLLVTLAGFTVVLDTVPLEIPGLRLGLSPAGFLLLCAILVPAIVPAAALQLLVASASRSFKEAQTAAQIMALLPILPGLFLMFSSFHADRWAYGVPLLGHDLLVNQVLKGEAVSPLNLALTTGVSLALGAALTLATIRRYDRERVLFG
jgi:sodium transport system permease protein